jgi:imidazolonepropionase-like amidohydrolase
MRTRYVRRLVPHLFTAAAVLVAATSARAGEGPDRVVPTGSADGTWAFTDVTVIPMDGERTLPNQTVVVVDGVITVVGPNGSVEVPEGATTIDGSGRYLMPGLAEMHAHVPPQGRPSEQALDELMFLYVANGITTIRGMLGSPYQIDLAQEIRNDEHLAPMFYAAAPSLNQSTAPTPAAAEAGIRDASAAGYDLMKIHPGIPIDAWDRMVRVANEVGLTFGGHVPADVGIRHALETGISTVDHVDGYLEGSASDEFIAQQEAAGFPIQVSPALLRNLDEGKMLELAQLSLETGVFVVPTQYLWENLYMQVDADEILGRPDMAYVSEQQRSAWRNQNNGQLKMTGEDASLFRAARDRMLEILVEAGVPLLMGTDSPQLFNVPGFALHRELAKIADIGIDEYTILESGTRNVGRYVSDVLGLDGNFGTVAPGQRADLVLLEANPLEDLDNLTARAGVMVRGTWVSAEQIEAGLAEIAVRHAN